MRMHGLVGGVLTNNGTPRATTLLCRLKITKGYPTSFNSFYDPMVSKNKLLIEWAEKGFNDGQS